MRSFAAVVHREGDPPHERLLRHLGAALRLPNSSEPEIRIDGHCGLITVDHTPPSRRPPAGRPQDGWLAGSMRLDDRETSDLTDGELVLRAWQRDGTDCADHLRGDYAFVVWDGNRLHGVRDRFGVRPFYYARAGRALIVSDVLAAILAHPETDAETLDPGAVADYLHSGVYEDAQATIYAHVRRLPPGHTLTAGTSGDVVVRRYWTPRDAATRQAIHPAEELTVALSAAVRDRIRTDRALVFMSGGLDSTTLAALAHETLPEGRVGAFTSVYRSRIADLEEGFAREAARSIGIPIECFPLDDYSPLRTLEAGMWTPEPGPLLTAAMTRDVYTRAAELSPIALHGHPADALLLGEVTPSLLDLLSRGRVLPFLADLVRYWRVRHRPPFFIVRALLGRQRRESSATPPAWLEPSLATKLAARTRQQPPAGLKPATLEALDSAAWSSYFEWAHPLMTGAPIEVAYPFCDLRVVELALGMKPIPWLVGKHVLREVLRGRVSETIRQRRKTTLSSDPWTMPAAAVSDLRIDAAARYIDGRQLAEACSATGFIADATLRAVLFEYWLRELPSRVCATRKLL